MKTYKTIIYVVGLLTLVTGCASWDDKNLSLEQRQKIYQEQRDRIRNEDRDWRLK